MVRVRYIHTIYVRLGSLIQVIDLGVIAHPGSYLRDIWNLMDALVVICAIISFVFDMM